jgi:hypothetical protein
MLIDAYYSILPRISQSNSMRKASLKGTVENPMSISESMRSLSHCWSILPRPPIYIAKQLLHSLERSSRILPYLKMPKRTASKASTSPTRSHSLRPRSKRRATRSPSPPYSPTRPVQSAPARLNSRISRSVLEAGYSEDELVDEQKDPLLYRVLTGLEYTRAQHAHGEPVTQTTRFRLSKRGHLQPGSALSVLRQAGLHGHALRIAVSVEYEVWEIGIPRPEWVSEGAFGGTHDPQWFYGLDAAHVKAGPFAEAADVKKARAALEAATRRNKRPEKSRREQEIDWKLQEWHRRFNAGETMNDSDGSDTDRSLFALGASDGHSADDGDDEPITPTKVARCKAERESRAAVAPSSTSNRRQSVSSESDGYRPSPSSSTDLRDTSPSESGPRAETESKSQQNNRISQFEAASNSEDDEPLVPVFSKWKAAQKARNADSSSATSKRQWVTPSSSEREDDAVPPQRQVRPDTPMSTHRRRVFVESSDDE